jgi:Flp pilus assembly protein TadG
MKKKLLNLLHHPNKGQKGKGQILVVLAIIFLGLIVVSGLVIDLGYMYVSVSRLRQAVDSASLAASSQFRKDYTLEGLIASAQQFLDLNHVANTTDISIETCENTPGDPVLCTTPARKMVRVSVTQDVPLFFLPVIGINTVPITVSSVSEAASVDLVLLIDTSESMANGDADHPIADGSAMLDPYQCNDSDPDGTNDGFPGDCQPFQAIKSSASQLIDQLFEGYDRVSIVTFDQYPHMVLPLTTDFNSVRQALMDLTVYEGISQCPYINSTRPTTAIDLGGPCRLFETNSISSFYYRFDCPMNYPLGTDPSRCTSTNIGGGLAMASNALTGAYPVGFSQPPMREDALWVIILLTDGAANAGYDVNDNPFCPEYTWATPPSVFCRDQDARPTLPSVTTYTNYLGNVVAIAAPQTNARHPSSNHELYDADDYARDMADAAAYNNNTLIFTIGLGDLVRKPTTYEVANNRPPSGETLLKYTADKGQGLYYFAPSGNQLTAIFHEIGNKIATRLTR